MRLSAPVFGLVVAFLARWVQLHPEKIVMKGYFSGENSLGARFFRGYVVVAGSFFVVVGVSQTLSLLIFLLPLRSSMFHLTVELAALAIGVLAAIHVRSEVRRRPRYVSNNPCGWWP